MRMAGHEDPGHRRGVEDWAPAIVKERHMARRHFSCPAAQKPRDVMALAEPQSCQHRSCVLSTLWFPVAHRAAQSASPSSTQGKEDSCRNQLPPLMLCLLGGCFFIILFLIVWNRRTFMWFSIYLCILDGKSLPALRPSNLFLPFHNSLQIIRF